MEISQETNSNSAVWCHVITSSYRDAGENVSDGQGGEGRRLQGQVMHSCSGAAPSSLSCLPLLSQKANCLFPIREGHRNLRHLVADSRVSEGKNRTKLQCYYEVDFPICGKTQNLTNTVITVSVKIDKYFKKIKKEDHEDYKVVTDPPISLSH